MKRFASIRSRRALSILFPQRLTSLRPRGASAASLAVTMALALVATGCGDSGGVQTPSATTGQGDTNKSGDTSSTSTENTTGTTSSTSTTSGSTPSSDTSSTTSNTDTNGGTQNLLDMIGSQSRFSVLKSAIERAGLESEFSGTNNRTILAPTDLAFANFPKAQLDEIMMDTAKLRTFLLHHVIDGRITNAELAQKPYAKSMADYFLFVDISAGTKVGGAVLVEADKAATNGMLHVIGELLQPPTKNIAEIAAENPDLERVLQLAEAAKMTAALSGTEKLTVLAPTDQAFARLGPGALSTLLGDESLAKERLNYHILPGDLVTYDWTAGTNLATKLPGTFVSPSKEDSIWNLNRSEVTMANIVATNGVIQVLDRVLDPRDSPSSEVGTLAEKLDDPKYSTLKSALVNANLLSQLSATGPLTLLAPNNDAFAKIPQADLDKLLNDRSALRELLLHHVLDGEQNAAALSGRHVVRTEVGYPLLVKQEAALTLGGSSVVTADVDASNGVMHEIDTVIMPPTETIVEIARRRPELSTFYAALWGSDLLDATTEPGTLTVFAPNEDAFNQLKQEIGLSAFADLMANRAELTAVLNKHVHGELKAKGDLVDGLSLASLDPAKPIMVTGTGVDLRINTETYEDGDIVATNGVIHIVGGVLDDPT